MKSVDLNSDIGEGFGVYTMGDDGAILRCVSSVNVACGWHAGDALIMHDLAQQAKALGVGLGAHVGYPDLLGFGRRTMQISPKEARCYTLYQVGALEAFAQSYGFSLQHVKLHGSFYNQASHHLELAQAVLEAIQAYNPNLIVLTLAQSTMSQEGQKMGLKIAQEAFIDRHYQANGQLLPRSHPKALIHDPQEAIDRALKMVLKQKVSTPEGVEIEIKADSLCVHGDTPCALELAKQVRHALEIQGVCIQPLVRVLGLSH
ncbi:LamB/YcsF family protein [Helicobacter baculiformis]|uniref:5-oxoprolinase subunit A n=1 Tax=Helicobacter baculiformis TaxID=427351 RepID=A0ABV7ZHX9_9HELI|nr:5-oxoprolinase subunit PxpA [Helicobacter baculiformis]